MKIVLEIMNINNHQFYILVLQVLLIILHFNNYYNGEEKEVMLYIPPLHLKQEVHPQQLKIILMMHMMILILHLNM